MIAVFGLMVGMYIITRMFDLMARRAEEKAKGGIVILAGLTILVTVGSMLYFLLGGDALSRALHFQ